MGTFTIYNCGTGYDELKNDAVADLFSRTTGDRAVDKLICAGPGSTLMTRPGYDPAKKPGEYAFSKFNIGKGIQQKIGKILGVASGVAQVDVNVRRVMEILAGLPVSKSREINMAGWSRGACTCHAMANAMSHSDNVNVKGMKVNIFAFDPVPGTNNLDIRDWTVIPPNVKNYTCIFMENEYRKIMHSAYLTFMSTNTRRKLLNLPGRHWFAVEETAGFGEVAALGLHLAEEFLEQHGTKFKPSKKLENTAVLEKYSEMILNTPGFFTKQKFLGGSSKEWTRWGGNHGAWVTVDNHLLSSSPYFINSHHKRVFRQRFPLIFKYYFEMGIFPESRATAVWTEKSMEKLVYDPVIREMLEHELRSAQTQARFTHMSLRNFAEVTNLSSKTKGKGTFVQAFGQKEQHRAWGKQPDEDMSDAFSNLFEAA